MKAYAIADLQDEGGADELLARVERLARCGVDVIQLRARSMNDEVVARIAREIRNRIPRGDGPMFYVNGRTEMAIRVGADGVHLPENGPPVSPIRHLAPSLGVGRSCHSVEACRKASSEGADYVLLGPVFAPRSKRGDALISREHLEAAVNEGVPVFALGGIDRTNLKTLEGTGIVGIAAITLLMKDEPLEAIVDEIHRL